MTIPYSPSLTSPLVRFFSFPSKGDNTLHCISETTPILPRMWIASFAQKLSDERSAVRKPAPIMRSGLKPVRNTKAYLLAALFNAVSTLDSYYTMQANSDFGGSF